MISGAHAIVYSKDSEADRAFFRDVLQLPHVDVGGGWLIFGLPPSEVAVHPSESSNAHELYLMCDDVEAFVAAMGSRGLACDPVKDEGWGLLTHVTLPGGGKVGVYQPRHARPDSPGKSKKPAAKKAAKKAKKAEKTAKKTAKTAKKTAKKTAEAEPKAAKKAAKKASKR